MPKRLVIDIDGTLTEHESSSSYAEKSPNSAVVERLREYQSAGFEIVLYSSRNMRTYNQSLGKINAFTLPVIIGWLAKNDVPYDEIYVGKPWCGLEGFYVDDRAIRPDEFVKLSYEEVRVLIGATSAE